MIHAVRAGDELFLVRCEDGDAALSMLVTNGIVSPDTPVVLELLGDVARVRGTGLTVTDEGDLFTEARTPPTSSARIEAPPATAGPWVLVEEHGGGLGAPHAGGQGGVRRAAGDRLPGAGGVPPADLRGRATGPLWGPIVIPKELVMSILRLLHHSWSDIGFRYDGLTEAERACIDREEHAALVSLMEKHGLVLGPGPTGPESWALVELYDDGDPGDRARVDSVKMFSSLESGRVAFRALIEGDGLRPDFGPSDHDQQSFADESMLAEPEHWDWLRTSEKEGGGWDGGRIYTLMPVSP